MYGEDCENAIRHFETVLSFENEVQDKEMLAIANFWIARCQTENGPLRKRSEICRQR